ncbi:MAG: NifU family protein [Pseudomonadota bacterium]
MFIETEPTPNPATLKFLPGRAVLPDTTRDFRSADEAHVSPLASALFEISGVNGVYLGSDFITVTKTGSDEWQHLKPAILGTIMDHYLSGQPMLNENAAPEESGEEFFNEKDADTVATIKELLETRIRPAVAGDGGDITFKGYRDGIVYLTMRGACAGCPSSTMTLKHGIENLLRHFLPDVQGVEAA